jgi:7-keto-8-aminopelargonate synthetase-like enzyme
VTTNAESVHHDVAGPRRYRNTDKMIDFCEPVWLTASDRGLINLHVDAPSNNTYIVRETGQEVLSLCSFAYLGLNTHPKVIEGAVDALQKTKTMGLGVGHARVRHNLLGRLEEEFSDLFGAYVMAGVTCSALSAGILPLLAAGHVAEGGRRVMVFDRFCHFSMAYMKPVCAEESLVFTCNHNDLNYLEDMCRKYPRVAYIADGAYSMGGDAALEGLLELQDRYGLFLYFDDSHSLSIVGERGEGMTRSQLPEMNPLTIIVASLNKGFGTGGGIAMLGQRGIIDFFQHQAGPVAWSQNMEIPVVGASLASIEIHRSSELGQLQGKLQSNIDYFDSILPTRFAGNGLPIRIIDVAGPFEAVNAAAALFERGFYNSAVFFPIVTRGEGGIRVMLRAQLTEKQIAEFVDTIQEIQTTL